MAGGRTEDSFWGKSSGGLPLKNVEARRTSNSGPNKTPLGCLVLGMGRKKLVGAGKREGLDTKGENPMRAWLISINGIPKWFQPIRRKRLRKGTR